ncbi:MAG: hypothetical protein P1V51_20875 [Deltaproteobacteria bacterium]|nr:hypothetical protein [Deltaproteobacteria bacterium]
MTWSWIYAFTGLTGALWVLLSGVMAGIGGGDSSSVDGFDGSIDGGVDGLDGGFDGGLDGGVEGLDGGLDANVDGGFHGTDAGGHALDLAHTGIDSIDAGYGMGEAQPGFPFLSPYVISAFLAGFGLAGYASLELGLGVLLHLPIALTTGLGMGGAVGIFFHKLRTTWSQSSEVRRRHLLGAEAQVSVSIPEGKVGEVSLIAAGSLQNMAARSLTGGSLPVGTTVLIERLEGSTAIVREPVGRRLERLGSTNDSDRNPSS